MDNGSIPAKKKKKERAVCTQQPTWSGRWGIMKADRRSEVTNEIPLSPRPTAWRLEIQDEQEGWTIPLADGRPVRVGSSRRSEVVVRDPTVSGVHLELAVLGNGVHVKD